MVFEGASLGWEARTAYSTKVRRKFCQARYIFRQILATA
jgi:hypothetical protein